MNAVRLIYTFKRDEFGFVSLHCDRTGHADDMLELHAANLHKRYQDFLNKCGHELGDPNPVTEIEPLD